ncbi:MAG: oligosaccharide flippase family protein [Planctomycetota bacterium]|jgi:PST family polysaccharide transporter/lipopolysaccharide exporter
MIADKIGRMSGASIKAKSARAVIALGIGTVAGRATRFLKTMILAKFLLAPDQLGVMAIIMSFSMAFEALMEVGVKQSVIQNKQGASDDYLNAAWWMQVARGLCLFAVASLLAPWLSSFYEYPELSRLLRVAFIAVVLRGFISPRAFVLEREFKFGQAVFLLQGSAVLGAAVAVGLAVVMRNVWALVLGFVAEMAIMCVLSFILVPFRPGFRIHRKSLGELIKYARRMFGLPVLTVLSSQAPILILAKVVSKKELGLYSLAALLAYIPVDLYARVVAPVLLPAFSKKQDDNRALCRGILQATEWTALFALPLVAFMACSGSELLEIAWTAEYVGMAMVFAVLCLQILIRSEALGLSGMYMAIGQPHLQRRFAMVRAVLILGFVYPAAVRFGPFGVAVVIILGNFALWAMQVFGASRVIDLDPGLYLRSYIPGLLVALPIILTFDLFRMLEVDSSIMVLTIGSTVFVATVVTGFLIMNRPERLSSSEVARA